jgi:hypothetical protein
MRILAIDAATRSGFCCAVAGVPNPRVWSERLKSPDDEPERAFKKMGIILRDQFAFEKPDLVIVEAPRQMGANIKAAPDDPRGFRFTTSPDTAYMLIGLVAVVYGICGPYGVRCISANVQTVRKHFIGQARPKDPKKLVLERAKLLGYVPRDCRDDNMSDACALFDWASATYARVTPASLTMFQEGAGR